MLDRVFILMGSPVSLFLARLFQLLLRLGICKSQTELDAVDLVGHIVKIFDDLLGDVAALKSGES